MMKIKRLTLVLALVIALGSGFILMPVLASENPLPC